MLYKRRGSKEVGEEQRGLFPAQVGYRLREARLFLAERGDLLLLLLDHARALLAKGGDNLLQLLNLLLRPSDVLSEAVLLLAQECIVLPGSSDFPRPRPRLGLGLRRIGLPSLPRLGLGLRRRGLWGEGEGHLWGEGG